MPEMELRGRRLTWRAEGMDRPGAPVLLAHCSLAHSGLWKPIQAALAETRPVVAADLPAHGRSDPPPEGESLQLFAAEFCTRLAEDFGRPVHLCGLSLGGATLARVAWKRPELAASLTMIEPVLFHLLHPPHVQPEIQAPPADDAELEADMRAFVGQWGAPGRDPFGGEERFQLAKRCFRLLREDNAWVMGRPPGQIELSDFERFRLPALLIDGETTEARASAVVSAIAGAIPCARRRTIPGAGHLSPVSHWREVLAELSAFFDAVDAGAERATA
ncbi:alpha/beta fold hydrolase [Albimonas sp. CAU 1670]|uniref:alpha/beta fold hydrolase n=1 Tax=Albimonas sp. CAU 1670 TaxID=3032599 RepID=UPI0023DCB994|nr:alpha/beta hydrolase [Albimonas sp. CAU 1670]MDF2233515.1 alpha/beta fold hydrolase [Albimonas sp. CAU 1670]